MTRLFTVLLFLSASQLFAVTGVVFIHGKTTEKFGSGGVAAANYWTGTVAAIRPKSGLRPLVCFYDGTQYMWVAAGQVADQIIGWIDENQNRPTNKIDIDRIVVVTHSFGGVIIRWILSNPDADPRFASLTSRILRVYSIAAPNLGSQAANAAGTLSHIRKLKDLIDKQGQGTDATRNCTTRFMEYYNKAQLVGTNGKPLPRQIYTMAGTSRLNDLEPIDLKYEIINQVVNFEGPNDGAVSARSAHSVGRYWRDTPSNHYHNSRNDYRKIGDELAKELNPFR
jgi:hypothetical protein